MLLWQAQKARTKLHRAAAEGGRIWLVGRWKEVVFGRFQIICVEYIHQAHLQEALSITLARRGSCIGAV